jgi:FixJ family two-component response regulator
MPDISRCVAVVDDDPSVLRALRRALHMRAFDCRSYPCAAEFLQSITSGLPDCLIIDLQMPQMSGLELHQNLRGRGLRIPTILITAHGDAQIQERSRALGILTVLSKPLRNAALFAAIHAAVDAPT